MRPIYKLLKLINVHTFNYQIWYLQCICEESFLYKFHEWGPMFTAHMNSLLFNICTNDIINIILHETAEKKSPIMLKWSMCVFVLCQLAATFELWSNQPYKTHDSRPLSATQ